VRLDSLRRCKPDQVRGSAGVRTLSALDPHVDAEALPCREAPLYRAASRPPQTRTPTPSRSAHVRPGHVTPLD